MGLDDVGRNIFFSEQLIIVLRIRYPPTEASSCTSGGTSVMAGLVLLGHGAPLPVSPTVVLCTIVQAHYQQIQTVEDIRGRAGPGTVGWSLL